MVWGNTLPEALEHLQQSKPPPLPITRWIHTPGLSGMQSRTNTQIISAVRLAVVLHSSGVDHLPCSQNDLGSIPSMSCIFRRLWIPSPGVFEMHNAKNCVFWCGVLNAHTSAPKLPPKVMLDNYYRCVRNAQCQQMCVAAPKLRPKVFVDN